MNDREGAGASARAPRTPAALALFAFLAFFAVAGLVALGVWQLERRTWKLALIEQVESRIHAAPVVAPAPAEWPLVTAERDAYRKVRLRGTFLNHSETLVQATTSRGSGYWVITPLKADAGFVVLVNRGFVPPDRRDPATRSAGQIVGEAIVTGLVRITEPKGGFLRTNDPKAGRWYSRDVGAIADARGLAQVAPYFIDADATPNAGGVPLGGLTVIRFPNSHLQYALTWFGLALLMAGAVFVVARHEWRLRQFSEQSQ